MTAISAIGSMASSDKPASSRQSKTLVIYFVFFALSVLVYHLVSEGAFSSILTLAAVFQCLAISLLVLQALSKGIQSISVKSLQLDAVALVMLLWLLNHVLSARRVTHDGAEEDNLQIL